MRIQAGNARLRAFPLVTESLGSQKDEILPYAHLLFVIVPKIWELFTHLWYAMCLVLLLAFEFVITDWTVVLYGALPAAIVFLCLNLMILYTILYATPTSGGGMGGGGMGGGRRFL